MSSPIRPHHPYAGAPRLPDLPEVELDSLVPGSHGPIEIEIGPGRGGFLFERLAAAPEVRLIGLEIRLKWAQIVDERLARQGHRPRARVFAEDAREVLPRLRPAAAVATIFVHFPDPWWKKRHTKRRVLGASLFDEAARLLAEGGELFIQTDVPDRADDYARALDAHPSFEPFGDAPGSARLSDNPYGARSPREHRAIADGLPVERLRYRRRALAKG